MHKVVFILILSFLMFMAGCGSSGYIAEEPENAQHIYIHNENDWIDNMYTLQQMQRQTMLDSQRSTDRLMDNMDETIRRMGQNNMDTLGTLENARMQDELYRQQQRENMRRAYGR